MEFYFGVVATVIVFMAINSYIKIDAYINVRASTDYNDCIEGTAIFENNVRVGLDIMMYTESEIANGRLLLHTNTGWDGGRDVQTELYFYDTNKAQLWIELNFDELAEPQKVYHFNICGFSKATKNGKTKLKLSAKNAKIFFY
jgi:hypothetical protein